MAYTKDIALTDEIHIDGVDVSDAFRSFGFSSEREQVDVSGFNATGADEFLAGKKTDSFTGECFYTPEIYALLGRSTTAARRSLSDGLRTGSRIRPANISTGTCSCSRSTRRRPAETCA